MRVREVSGQVQVTGLEGNLLRTMGETVVVLYTFEGFE